MVSIVIVAMRRRLSVHMRWVGISMVARIVLRCLVNARMDSRMHVHFGVHMATVRIANMCLPLLLIILVVTLLLNWVHTIVLVCFALVVLLFFHAQSLWAVASRNSEKFLIYK
jgi:hypothetical protein